MSALYERKTTSVGVGARMKMVHLKDPKKALLEELGTLPDDIVNLNKILVATYRRPEKTSGGIILTDRSNDEDIYQGKVGLIVAMGPEAFADACFNGLRYEVGQWVWLRPSDAMACQVNGVPCRVIHDERVILGAIPDPDCVW